MGALNDKWFEHRSDTLTLTQAVDIATVVRWAQENQRVRWVLPETKGEVGTGTVRSIGDENANFLTADDDVRRGFVRITTSGGFEWFPTIDQVVRMVHSGTMVAVAD